MLNTLDLLCMESGIQCLTWFALHLSKHLLTLLALSYAHGSIWYLCLDICIAKQHHQHVSTMQCIISTVSTMQCTVSTIVASAVPPTQTGPI